MSWNYSGNPETAELDKYRFAIGDTLEYDPIFQDEEIIYIISLSENNDRRMCILLQHTVNRLSRDIKKSLGPISEDPTKRLEHYKEQLKKYEYRLLQSGLSLPEYSYPVTFKKKMFAATED